MILVTFQNLLLKGYEEYTSVPEIFDDDCMSPRILKECCFSKDGGEAEGGGMRA